MKFPTIEDDSPRWVALVKSRFVGEDDGLCLVGLDDAILDVANSIEELVDVVALDYLESCSYDRVGSHCRWCAIERLVHQILISQLRANVRRQHRGLDGTSGRLGVDRELT